MWKRVLVPTLGVALVWIGVSAVTNYFGQHAISSLRGTLRNSLQVVRSMGNMQTALWQMQASATEAIKQNRDGFPFDANQHEAEFLRYLEEGEERATSNDNEDTRLLRQIRERFTEYRGTLHQLFDAAPPDGAAKQPSLTETMNLAVAVTDPCLRLTDHHDRIVRETIDHVDGIFKALNLIRLIIYASGPIVGVLLGFWVARTLKNWSTIHQLSVHLKDAAIGLEQEVGCIDISPTGELPALRNQVEMVSARISQVVRDLEKARVDMVRRERLAAVGELAAGVAHELRNPLTSVKLLVQTAAQRQRTRPLTERQCQVLLDEIGRMEETIQGLLDLARPAKLRRVHHDIRDTLRRALNLALPRAQQHGVQVLDGLPHTPVMIDGDPEQLHQVFVNLMLNAMEAMPDGGTVRVSLGGTEENLCRIKISDTGTGIPNDLLDRIFDPFVSGKDHGYGLGLAISRRIVADHKGMLTAVNRAEGGAVFTVALPLSDAEPSAERSDDDSALTAEVRA